MTSEKLIKLVVASMFAALCYICTTFVQIPSIKGYTHLGDGAVILSGVLLGPIYGSAAAGLGSMFADLLTGYASYAIPTFIIKATAAFAAWLIFKGFSKITKDTILRILSVLLGGICAGVVVTSCYFLYDMSVMGLGLGATAGIPGNIVQNVFGIITSTVMFPMLYRIPTVHSFSQPKCNVEENCLLK